MSLWIIIAALVAILAAVLVWLARAAPRPAPAPAPGSTQHNHFRVYRTRGDRLERVLVLTDQFNRNGRPDTIDSIQYLAVPVKKTDEQGRISDIADPDEHLTVWRFKPTEDPPEPSRTVTFTNQFGSQTTDLMDRAYLLAPAQLREPRLPAPRALNHFKCYQVSNPPLVNTTVTLEDRFGGQRVKVTGLLYFCVPAEKLDKSADETNAILNPDRHLAIYLLEERAEGGALTVEDQFGERRLDLEMSDWLIVPSEKSAWSER